jgi:integrase
VFASREEAQGYIRALKRVLAEKSGKTLEEAVRDYEAYMREDKENKPGTVKENVRRVLSFFPDSTEPLALLTPSKCSAYYEVLTRRPTVRGQPMSVDTHRNILACTKTFLRWCVSRKQLRTNPLESVEGKGKRRHGKEQLRVTEAQAWLDKALELAPTEVGATAAMLALLMNLRASEIVERVARDVDDGGRLLWVPASKTEAGRRTQWVPDILQPLLLPLAEGKGADDYLFPGRYNAWGRYRTGHRDRGWVRSWVRRICELAGVPKVTAHGMRGTHASLAIEHGSTGAVVAAALGHEKPSTTYRSYAKRESVDGARQSKVLAVLAGGKGG